MGVSATTTGKIDEKVWKEILSFIEFGNVLPILGQGVMTIEPDNELFMPWLVKKLSDELDVELDDSCADLNAVVCKYLMGGGNQQMVHLLLHKIIEKGCPLPGKTLQQIAEIEPLRLMISTTFDPLLAMALQSAGIDVELCSYAPNAEHKDIPFRIHSLNKRTVYQILGRSSRSGSYVVWEDDMMEFIFGLHKDLSLSTMPHLAMDLANPQMHYLILGLNFSDWLVRFFIRAARQSRMSDPHSIDYIAEAPDQGISSGLVVFFKSAGKNIHVIQCDPRDFVDELSERWREHAKTMIPQIFPAQPTSTFSKGSSQNEDDIFISYSSKDIAAATALKAGLEAQGLSVWMDKTRLRSGDDYHLTFEAEIARCPFFISVISQNTEKRDRAYFHRERNWAANSVEFLADHVRGEYYHPVIIDDTPPDRVEMEPENFKTTHRISLPGGVVTDAFVQRLKRLVEEKRRRKNS